METEIQKLLAVRDFAGAAAVEEGAKARAARARPAPQPSAGALRSVSGTRPDDAETMEAQIEKRLAARDFAGAAALEEANTARQVEQTRGEIRKRLDVITAACDDKIAQQVVRKDYRGAADLDNWLTSLKADVRSSVVACNWTDALDRLTESLPTTWGNQLPMNTPTTPRSGYTLEREKARAAAVDARAAATSAEAALETRGALLEAEIKQHVLKRDYKAAADCDNLIEELVEDHRAKTELAEFAEASAAAMGVAKFTAESGARAAQPQPTARRQAVTCQELDRADVVLLDRVAVECARVLSVGKVCTVPCKGKNKNKGKSKGGKVGKVKGRGKGLAGEGKGKGAADGNTRQECVAVYIGQEGRIACILAFGDDVQRLPLDSLVGCDIDVQDVKPRVGQPGVVYCDERSQLVKRAEQHHANGTLPFPYDISEVTHDIATRDYIQHAELGSFVSLVLCAHQVEEGETSNTQEPYVTVHGIDMDGVAVGPVRLWRWTEAEASMQVGGVYIIRGLKVMKETVWSDEKWGYVPRDDGAQTVECNFRVAVEDVSGVQAIASYFS